MADPGAGPLNRRQILYAASFNVKAGLPRWHVMEAGRSVATSEPARYCVGSAGGGGGGGVVVGGGESSHGGDDGADEELPLEPDGVLPLEPMGVGAAGIAGDVAGELLAAPFQIPSAREVARAPTNNDARKLMIAVYGARKKPARGPQEVPARLRGLVPAFRALLAAHARVDYGAVLRRRCPLQPLPGSGSSVGAYSASAAACGPASDADAPPAGSGGAPVPAAVDAEAPLVISRGFASRKRPLSQLVASGDTAGSGISSGGWPPAAPPQVGAHDAPSISAGSSEMALSHRQV